MAMKQVQIQKHLTQETSISWSALFPHNTTTIKGSQIFIKQLTAVIFSCITHIRGIFPEYAFDDKVLDERRLKILSSSCDCKNAYLMTRWLKSAFKALDYKFMQTLTLEILTLDGAPLEYYAIDYTYNSNGDDVSCTFYSNQEKENAVHFSNSDVENSTKKLIFALLDATESLGELPITYQLQLRIHYYDDRTPATYTPEYFINVPNYEWDNVNSIKRIRLGSVNTNFHSMTLNVGSTLIPSDGSDQPLFNYDQQLIDPNGGQAIFKRESWFDKKLETYSLPINGTKIKDEEVTQSPTNEENVQMSLLEKQTMFDENAVNGDDNSTVTVDSGDELTAPVIQDPLASKAISPKNTKTDAFKLNCFCEINQEKETFICQRCGCAHHLICYKFWPDSQEINDLNCYLCAKVNNLTCIDEQLITYPDKQAKNLMIYRQLLYRAQYLRKISIKIIAKELDQTEGVSQKFMKKFINEGFTKPTLNKDVFTVNCKKLNQYIQSYFHY